MTEEKPKGFLEELQSLDDIHKRRILIISTVVIMLVVITVWFSLFNGILASASQSNNVADATSTTATDGTTVAAVTTPDPASASGPGMWQNIENGMASIGNIFKGHTDYQVTPQSN